MRTRQASCPASRHSHKSTDQLDNTGLLDRHGSTLSETRSPSPGTRYCRPSIQHNTIIRSFSAVPGPIALSPECGTNLINGLLRALEVGIVPDAGKKRELGADSFGEFDPISFLM